MDIKEFIKLRYMFLKSQYKTEQDLPTSIRIAGKIHELDILVNFMNDGNIDRLYEIRKQ